MKQLSSKILTVLALALASLISSSAIAQVTHESVINNAIKKNETQPGLSNSNQNTITQLLNNLYSDPNTITYPQNDPNADPYNTPPPTDYSTQQQPSYYNTPAGDRFRASQVQRRSSGSVSANNPYAAWEAVKRSQSYGFKRNMTDLDDLTITEDDILAATDNEGVIDVDKISDTNPGPHPTGETCYPDGTSYVFGICTRINIDRTSNTPQYSEYSPGLKPQGGVCQGYKPIPGARVLN